MGRIYRDLEKQPRFGFLPAMASLSAPSWPSLSAPSRWCTASPPQSQRGGVLDGGDSPHEPRLHWSTCASTRRTMSPASRPPSSLIRSRSRFELVDNRANLVGAVHEPVLANPVREPAVHRRFARLGSFTVHGSRRVSREESVHGSRFTDSGWGLVGSRFGVHGLGAGASWFTVHGSRFRRELTERPGGGVAT